MVQASQGQLGSAHVVVLGNEALVDSIVRPWSFPLDGTPAPNAGTELVPGAAQAATLRRQILEGVDGIVFVADLRPERHAATTAAPTSAPVDAMTRAVKVDAFMPCSAAEMK